MASIDVLVPQHPIQVAARRSGLSTHVIRAWEKRYQAVKPQRSGTSRRLYSDEEINRLGLLRRVTEAGWRIGDVAGLPDEKLMQLLKDEGIAMSRAAPPPELEAPTLAKLLQMALDSVARLDGPALVQIMERATATQTTPVVMEQLITPLLAEIGDRWRMGRMRACHEHFVSAHLRTFLGETLAQASTQSDGPVLLVTSPAGQNHEIGALMAAVISARAGWRVMYLGPSLPADEIAFAADVTKARAIALSITYPADDVRLPAQLLRMRSMLPPGIPVFVGGAARTGYSRALKQIGAIMPADLLVFDKDLESLRRVRD
jgi:DNA-binding transcriptional MerR regulator/methylmalonyl-CoA mutase cobalamin-binding subunit